MQTNVRKYTDNIKCIWYILYIGITKKLIIFNIHLIKKIYIKKRSDNMRILVIEDEPSLNDLIILDVMLPNINGFDILKEIKRNKIKSKIIMLTAKSSLENKLEDLNSGANDYVTKPFHMDELLARVSILIRQNSLNIISYKDIKLDTTNYNLKCKPHIKSL